MTFPYLDVMDFGAKGNGTGDDRKAIQKAVDQASVHGNVVILPAGRYPIHAPIVIKGNGVTLQGAGTYATFLLPIGSFPAVEGAGAPHPLFNGVFADFQIIFEQPTLDAVGIDMSNFSASTARQVQVTFVEGASCAGFLFQSDAAGSSPYYNLIVQCAAAGGKMGTGSAGFRFAPRGNLGNSNANQIIGGHVTTCDYGVWFETGYGNLVDGLVTESIYQAHYAFGSVNPSLDSRANRVRAGYAEGRSTSHLTRFAGGGGVLDNVVYSALYSGLAGSSLTTPGLIDPQSTIRTNVVIDGPSFSGDLTMFSNRHFPMALTSLATSGRVVTFDDLSGFVAIRAEAQPDSQAQDVAQLRADFNALLAKLRASGVIAS